MDECGELNPVVFDEDDEYHTLKGAKVSYLFETGRWSKGRWIRSRMFPETYVVLTMSHGDEICRFAPYVLERGIDLGGYPIRRKSHNAVI